MQLNALMAQWRELCEKNIEIQIACADLQNRIDQLKMEAKEKYVWFFSLISLMSFTFFYLASD